MTIDARESDIRACPGKIRFATRETADLRARQIYAVTGNQMHAYDCTACDWIHLGHPLGAATGRRHGERRRQDATGARPSAAER